MCLTLKLKALGSSEASITFTADMALLARTLERFRNVHMKTSNLASIALFGGFQGVSFSRDVVFIMHLPSQATSTIRVELEAETSSTLIVLVASQGRCMINTILHIQ